MRQAIIKLNSSTDIDLSVLIDSRLLVQANSGGGKSWLLRRLLEQSHGKVQQIVIDPEGEFASLREKFDYVLAGKDGDTPAEPRSAALLARRLLELNVSAIIDLYELHPQERKRFVRLFLEAMVNSPKELHHPCLVIIDEAHTFAPEKGQSEAMDAVIGLASLGRKRGFCAVLATQRISKLHKDAAAECNNKLIGRTGLDIDRKRAAEELGFTTKEQILSLRTLDPGEFYAFGPAISTEVISVKVGDVKTTHPKAGSRFKVKTIPPTAKIKALLPKLSDLPAEAKKEALAISEMQKEIRNLKQENTTLKRKPEVTKIDPKEYTRNEQVAKLIEAAIQKTEKSFVGQLAKYEKAFDNILRVVEQVSKPVKFLSPDEMVREVLRAGTTVHYAKPIAPPKPVTKKVEVLSKVFSPMPYKVENPLYEGEVKITGGALRMLKVLVSRYPMKLSKVQLATFSKLKSSSGTYGTYLSTLRTAGLIQDNGDLFEATQAGIDYIGESPNPPQSSEEVREMWMQNLNGGAKRMFEVLTREYPTALSKDELAQETGMMASSGTFGTYLSILRSNGLVEVENGAIKASENLFI